jgi:hypothetical protein
MADHRTGTVERITVTALAEHLGYVGPDATAGALGNARRKVRALLDRLDERGLTACTFPRGHAGRIDLAGTWAQLVHNGDQVLDEPTAIRAPTARMYARPPRERPGLSSPHASARTRTPLPPATIDDGPDLTADDPGTEGEALVEEVATALDDLDPAASSKLRHEHGTGQRAARHLRQVLHDRTRTGWTITAIADDITSAPMPAPLISPAAVLASRAERLPASPPSAEPPASDARRHRRHPADFGMTPEQRQHQTDQDHAIRHRPCPTCDGNRLVLDDLGARPCTACDRTGIAQEVTS